MNALSIVNKVVSPVSYKMHKTRRDAVTACVKSLLNGSAATVTSLGQGINTKDFEKPRGRETKLNSFMFKRLMINNR